MRILMTGIDHRDSVLSVREKFAVSMERAKSVLAAYAELPYIGGCVLISTCNRTEVYISVLSIHKDIKFNITDFLCRNLGLDPDRYYPHFTERSETAAYFHLCKVASGMDSQILGDDQIITQVRESLELSRELGYTDCYLETMFRTAIKAAKQIKTDIVLRTPGTAAAPLKAVEKMKSLIEISGKKAVVIGNGKMGRLAAEILLKESVQVTVTLREYKDGTVQLAQGADTVLYSRRYESIEDADIVLSATSSPHYTLHYGDFIKLRSVPAVIADLAVPRDIEPEIGEITGVTLFTIDDLGEDVRTIPQEKMLAAGRIIENNLRQYYKWCEYKETQRLSSLFC